MPQYWMISVRDKGGTGLSRNSKGPTFGVSDSPNDNNQLPDIKNWKPVTFSQFRKSITDVCATFPDLPQRCSAARCGTLNNGIGRSFPHFRSRENK